MTPILMIGAGRMGGAMLQGWIRTGAFPMRDVLIRERSATPDAEAAGASGAQLNPDDGALHAAQTVVLGVKPQVWREVAREVEPLLSPDAVILSLAVGVRLVDLTDAFNGRRVVRSMPTTGVAVAKGACSLVSSDPEALRRGHALFDPIAATVDLADEAQMDAAAAVSGSAPAYFYALLEALQAAGQAQGLAPDASRALARAAFVGAAALMDESGAEPAELRRNVTSPGGTTEAALRVFMGEAGFASLTGDAVAAAIERARELAEG